MDRFKDLLYSSEMSVFSISHHNIGGFISTESACNTGAAGDAGLISGLGRSPEGKSGNPLQYSCLENPIDRGAWWATVHGDTKSQKWLKQFSTCTWWHYSWFALFLLNIGDIFDWWQIWSWGSSWSWMFESMSGSSTFHQPNQSLAGSHACPRASDAQMEKEVWLSSHIKVEIFILEIMSCNLLPFPAQEKHFERDKYKEQTKSTKVMGIPI